MSILASIGQAGDKLSAGRHWYIPGFIRLVLDSLFYRSMLVGPAKKPNYCNWLGSYQMRTAKVSGWPMADPLTRKVRHSTNLTSSMTRVHNILTISNLHSQTARVYGAMRPTGATIT